MVNVVWKEAIGIPEYSKGHLVLATALTAAPYMPTLGW